MNTNVNTDLVGEIVEVRDSNYSPSGAARGRVRAVTHSDGAMVLWLHIVDEKCREVTRTMYWYTDAEIGDVFAIGLAPSTSKIRIVSLQP